MNSEPGPPRPDHQPLPPAGPVMPNADAATGEVVVHSKPVPVPLNKSMTSPQLSIDGYPAPAQWGPVSIRVPAGRHRVAAETNYLFPYGRAELDVDVPAGGRVELYYAAPAMTFVAGRLGLSPQRTPAAWISWAGLIAMVLVGLFIVILILGILIGS